MKANEAYSGIVEKELKASENLHKRASLVVTLRLLAFVAFGLALYGSFAWATWFAGVSIVLLAAFLWLVRYHGKIRFLRDKARAKVAMAERELAALNGNFSGLDQGAPAPPEHPWAHDLDVFGPNSFYQLFNRASTPAGIERVRRQLLTAPLSPEEMGRYQQAAQSLMPADDHRMDVIASASMIDVKPEEMEAIQNWLGERPAKSLSWVKTLQLVVPVYSLTFIVLASLGIVSMNVCTIALLVPLVVVGANLRFTAQVYDEVGKQGKLLDQLADMISEVRAGETSDPLTSSIREQLDQAEVATRKLAKILSAYDQRNNIFASLVTNALYIAELRNAWRVLQWREVHGASMRQWLNSLAEYELLLSLASFARNNEDLITWPSPDSGSNVAGKQLIHPLLASKKAVPNDLSLSGEKKVELITGANMAGKSTYLRTIGLSVLLAQIGGPVLGQSFSIGKVRMFTSMRTEDALDSGTSYFMAELKRLNRLMEEINDEVTLFALLDEILKGTNSLDKEQGSRAFIERLIKRNVRVVVATHDVSLTTLSEEYPTQLENHHFASEVDGDDLRFDYQIRPGVCDTMNATWLMRSMGLID